MVSNLNNRGIIRIVEASISILIIFSAVLVISSREDISGNSGLESFSQEILEEIAKNNGLREEIITNPAAGEKLAENFIRNRIL